MSQELQKSAVERAKDTLSITGEVKSYELYEKLREYRNNIHPDRFTDEEQKKYAEDKFKDIQALIAELAAHVQQEQLSVASSELAVYKPLYDNVYYQQKIDQENENVAKLKRELTIAQEQNRLLSERLEAKEDDALATEMKEIEALYRVSYRRLKPVGITLLLTGAIAIMTKMEEVSALIKKYAPIAEGKVDIVLFVLFVATCVLLAKQTIEQKPGQIYLSLIRRKGEAHR